MRCMPPESQGAWVVVAPRRRLAALGPLIRAHERVRPVHVIELNDGRPPPPEAWIEWIEGASGALLIGDRRFGARSALPGPFLHDGHGRLVPAGWLPDAGDDALAHFANTAWRVLRRAEGGAGPIALMSQWDARYLALAGRMAANVRDHDPALRVFQWTADRITRDDLVRALGSGPGLGIYFGHGRPRGWAGYHGLRAHHLLDGVKEPAGAILSMTCRTASRWDTGLSFSEAIVLGGVAAAAVGAVAPVHHLQNMRWMLGLADALGAGETVLGAALRQAAPHTDRPGSTYRIIGDPLVPLVGAADALRLGNAVWAPAPTAELWEARMS